MSFPVLVEDFLSFMHHNRGRSERLAVVYRLALSRLGEFMADLGRDPMTATHEDLVAFTGPWLFRKGLVDPVSRRTHVSAVRGFFKWATWRGHVRDNAAAGVPQPKVGRKIPRMMTLADLEKIMWQPDFGTLAGVRDAAMIAVLGGCGLRASGLAGLNESNLVRDVIDAQPRLFVKVLEKGGRERVVPVPQQAELLIRLYLDHPDLAAVDRLLPDGDKVLFVSLMRRDIPLCDYRGEKRRFRREQVHALVRRHGTRAGVDPSLLHPHAMRHLFGTELAEDDVPTVTAQNLLGHADPKSTEVYQHLARRKLMRVADKSNPLAKIKTPVTALLNQIKRPAP
ncbi:MAG: tyrosine-type recombinase/integrase [Rhodocyclaceae bacterium]|nr:tyrosine-type recombinase/integrase [Rhodocyclaceae bacterium]